MSGLIIKPEMSEAAEKAKRNAHQQERRRIALAALRSVVSVALVPDPTDNVRTRWSTLTR